MIKRALIGHTGFVGTNLLGTGHYEARFNSSNSTEMRGRTFDEVVCAGVSAIKWKANKEPEVDWHGVEALMNNIASVQAGKFILISTVDVYGSPVDVAEDAQVGDGSSAYGIHRAKLEQFVATNFPNYLIIRLPALYGKGLKKNYLYDLCHDNMVNLINPNSAFQWYDVRRLENDIRILSKSNIKIINISPEPVAMREIGDRYFPGKLGSQSCLAPASYYNIWTKYAPLLGGSGNYHFAASQVLDGIGEFLSEYQ